jgi:hypothetical protein
MADKVSIAECRRILGNSADGMADAEIEAMRDDLERTANVLYDQMAEEVAQQGMQGIQRIHWAAYFQQTGEGE